MNNFTNLKKTKNAFTLVELLIVVSIIAILASVLLNVVNPERQRNLAQDAVNKATISKISEAVESFAVIQNSSTYPTTLFDIKGNATFSLLSITESDISADIKFFNGDTDRDLTKFCICVQSKVNNTKYFWYKSTTKKIQELSITPSPDKASCIAANCN